MRELRLSLDDIIDCIELGTVKLLFLMPEALLSRIL